MHLASAGRIGFGVLGHAACRCSVHLLNFARKEPGLPRKPLACPKLIGLVFHGKSTLVEEKLIKIMCVNKMRMIN